MLNGAEARSTCQMETPPPGSTSVIQLTAGVSVRVDDLNSFSMNESSERGCSNGIELPMGRAGKDSQSEVSCPQREWLARTRRDHTFISGPRERLREPQYLPLAAAPTPLGIDVQHRDR